MKTKEDMKIIEECNGGIILIQCGDIIFHFLGHLDHISNS